MVFSPRLTVPPAPANFKTCQNLAISRRGFAARRDSSAWSLPIRARRADECSPSRPGGPVQLDPRRDRAGPPFCHRAAGLCHGSRDPCPGAGDRRAVPHPACNCLRERHRRAAPADPGPRPEAGRRGHCAGVHLLRHGRRHSQCRWPAGICRYRRGDVQHLARVHRGGDHAEDAGHRCGAPLRADGADGAHPPDRAEAWACHHRGRGAVHRRAAAHRRDLARRRESLAPSAPCRSSPARISVAGATAA